MKVQELINHLTMYAAMSPENGYADIAIKLHDAVCVPLNRADDYRGMPGEHFLVLVPDETGSGLKMQ